MSIHQASESANKIRQLQAQHSVFLQSLITHDPEQVLLQYLRSADIELRELAALQGYSQAFRLKAIKLLDKDSSYTLERIAEYNPDGLEAQAAKTRLKQLQSLRHRTKSFFIRFSK